jgi:predicted RNase H-like HicB family nuclease
MKGDMSLTYHVVAIREEDGRYSVSVPALPGCHTWGHNLAEALDMAQDAITLYLECVREDGEIPPEDTGEVAFDMGEAPEAIVRRVTVEEEAAQLA